MPSSLPTELEAARRQFIESGGHTTQSFGFGRVLGQIFALLYLSPRPMCLDEIADELAVSKASVSTTVRQLEGWSAVKQVWVKGDRRDFYEAETNFKGMLRHGLLTMVRKKLETAELRLDNIETPLKQTLKASSGEQQQDLQVVADRLKRAREFHNKISGLLNNPLLDHLL